MCLLSGTFNAPAVISALYRFPCELMISISLRLALKLVHVEKICFGSE